MALFPSGKGGGKGIAYGYKGKGVTIHLVVDAKGMPLSFSVTPSNGDERVEAKANIRRISIPSGKAGRPRTNPGIMSGDKGYDDKKLRTWLRRKGIKPEIPRRKWKSKAPRGRPLTKAAPRYQVERSHAWLQRKFRRIAVRWERTPQFFESFVALGIAMIWLGRILESL